MPAMRPLCFTCHSSRPRPLPRAPVAAQTDSPRHKSCTASRWRITRALLHFFWMRAGKNDFAEVMVYAAIIGVLLLERLFRYLKPRGVASR